MEASARLVVPGFKDRANLEGELRRGAPIGSRLSQHLLLSLVGVPRHVLEPAECRREERVLKGDPFVSRELYLTTTNAKVGPKLPLAGGVLCRVLKGVFGLADAPREWWLWLARSVESRGWQRNPLDQATWLLWDALLDVGAELGLREVTRDSFNWCDKHFQRKADGTGSLSMKAYHANFKEIYMPMQGNAEPDSPLQPGELRQLRALLGSFQWLVAQLRFDMGFPVSALQGEKPTVAAGPHTALRGFRCRTAGSRCFLASVRGVPPDGQEIDQSLNSVPLLVVADAKDVNDKVN